MRFIVYLTLVLGLLSTSIEAINSLSLKNMISTTENPFNYDLHLKVIPNEKEDAEVLIAMHGMGSDHTIADIVRLNPVLTYHIVSFNFPDYGSVNREIIKSKYGTFEEIAPALFVLKKFVVENGIDKIHLYGFSAGGGVIVNTLAILNSNRYDNELQKFGIGATEKKKILQSVQKGNVILEVPLKSFDEVADIHGSREIKVLAKRAHDNGLTPIENIDLLSGLSLNAFVYFATPDETLGNRDDNKYIQKLQQANRNGKTMGIIGKSGGHINYHPELWKAYKEATPL